MVAWSVGPPVSQSVDVRRHRAEGSTTLVQGVAVTTGACAFAARASCPTRTGRQHPEKVWLVLPAAMYVGARVNTATCSRPASSGMECSQARRALLAARRSTWRRTVAMRRRTTRGASDQCSGVGPAPACTRPAAAQSWGSGRGRTPPIGALVSPINGNHAELQPVLCLRAGSRGVRQGWLSGAPHGWLGYQNLRGRFSACLDLDSGPCPGRPSVRIGTRARHVRGGGWVIR